MSMFANAPAMPLFDSARQRAAVVFSLLCIVVSVLGSAFFVGRISARAETPPAPLYLPGQIDCDPGRMTLRVHPRADGNPVEVPINPCGFKA